ncbi:histidine kinase dimerization/phospho-acceptor domain-containing protein [Okeania hirsuta]
MELRTPLQGIIGLSDTLFEQEENPAKQENLSMIMASSRRLSSTS